ncbi:proton-coupled folate transporter-like [Haemaphysalis longicornis]
MTTDEGPKPAASGDGCDSGGHPGDSRRSSTKSIEDTSSLDTKQVDDCVGMVSGTSTPSLGRRVLDGVLVARLEIFLALFMISRFMTMTPVQELLLRKACLYRLHLNASVCSRLDDFEDVKNAAEKMASTTNMMLIVAALAPSSVLAIFIGPWCDKYGYRAPLISSSLGLIVNFSIVIVTVHYMELPLYVNILAAIPDGLSGGLICVITAVCSEATLITRAEGRRARFFAVTATMSLSNPLGSYIGGQLYGHYGWKVLLYVGLGTVAVALVWACITIKNLAKPAYAKDGLRVKLQNLFQLGNLRDSFGTVVKSRPSRGRLQLWCLFAAVCCVLFDQASVGIAYYYVRKMYSWTVPHYTTVQSVAAVVGVALNIPLAHLLARVFRIGDPAMALIGTCCYAAQMLLLGLAYKEWLYYVQCLVGLPSFLGQVGVRTHLSKLVAPDEVGKVFAFLSLFVSVLPIVGEVILTSLFNWSISFLPGLPYLVASCTACIAIGLIGYVTKVHRDTVVYEEMSKTDVPSGPIND